MFKFSFEMFDR